MEEKKLAQEGRIRTLEQDMAKIVHKLAEKDQAMVQLAEKD